MNPAGTARAAGLKMSEALPLASILTLLWPMRILACWPEGVEKNWTRKLLPGVLWRLPFTVVEPSEVVVAEERTEEFCGLLKPGSRSRGSFGITPLSPRSITKPAFEKLELLRKRLPVGASVSSLIISIPGTLLKAMTLTAPNALRRRWCCSSRRRRSRPLRSWPGLSFRLMPM